MKANFLFRSLWMFFFIQIFPNVHAQNPEYTCQLINAAQVSTKIFEFDIQLTSTNAGITFEYAYGQYGITVNPLIKNGGTVTATFSGGSAGATSGLPASNQPNSIGFVTAQNCIKISAKAAATGCFIPTAPGVRVVRVRLINTVDFGSYTPDLSWSFTATPYKTDINAYVGGPYTVVTVPAYFTNQTGNARLNPPVCLNPTNTFSVTGTASYCPANSPTGSLVGLSGSESDVIYTLYNNAVAQVPTVAGTGAAISFGNQLAGTYTVTGTRTCWDLSTRTSTMTGSAVISATTPLVPEVTIVVSASLICNGNTVTFTPTPVNGGSPTYKWFVNGILKTSGATYTYVPANSDAVYAIMTSTLPCVTSTTAVSNSVNMTVANPVTPAVTIAPGANGVCIGTTVTFTPIPVNGGSPTYQWFVNGISVSSGATYAYAPANGDAVYAVMTSSLPCATSATATSNTVNMTVTNPVTPAVTIAPSANGVCSGTAVTFTSIPVNGGSPTYDWFVNGVSVGSATTYTYAPANGDTVYAVMTSTLHCVTSATATSNTVYMTVTNPVTPAVTIAPSANGVCSGTFVTFTPTPVNGGSPTFQWFVNGVSVSSGATYNYAPANGDAVYAVMTSTHTCLTSATATSNAVNMTVTDHLTPAVTIAPSADGVCSGTSVTFTPTPVNGGSPTYQWFVNGISVSSGATYTYTPVNGDAVYTVMTSTLTCVTSTTATSNIMNMSVTTLVTPSVSIVSSGNPVIAGTTVTFTAAPVNGGTPAYQWIVNGSNVGTGSTYSYIPVNDDEVYVVMTTTLNCITAPTATSNTISMTVNLPTPTYQCELRNDVQVNDRNYEFDIYLLHTNTIPFELAAMQAGIYVNSGIIPGGATITACIVPGSSELVPLQQPTAANISITASTPNNTIKITGNAYPGPGLGTIISNTGQGTRFARIRVTCSAPFISLSQAGLLWSFAPPPFWPTVVQAYMGGLPATITNQASHLYNLNNPQFNPPDKNLNLKAFLEGLYLSSGTMRKAQGFDLGGNVVDQFPGNTADQVTVELRNSTTGALEYTLSNMNLSTTGSLTASVPAIYNGSYYLYVRHRNSIVTSTANPVSFAGSTITYDFSNAANKAFGDNMKDMGAGVFAFYCGDVDQDMGIGVLDMGLVDNQSAAFGGGYIPEDVNGDGSVGILDMGLVDNNSAAFVGAVLPFGGKKSHRH